MKLSRLAITALLLIVACNAPASSPTAIVPGERVGTYVLGKSTLRDVLGEDSREARKRLADRGLMFEFEQGRELKAVTVSSDGFRTPQGLKVGSTVDEVELALGKPTREPAGDKLSLEALAYPGITFYPKDGRVAAIRVDQTGG